MSAWAALAQTVPNRQPSDSAMLGRFEIAQLLEVTAVYTALHR
jgi:hypothetical protein